MGCVVTGNFRNLLGLPCDIALNPAVTHKKRRVNLVMQTGHMVINPTPKALELMRAWREVSEAPEFGLNDQETLALALAKVTDVSILHVDQTAKGNVRHACASKAAGVIKVNGRQRFKHKVLSALGLTYTEAAAQ